MKPCHLGNATLFDDETHADEARALCKRSCARLIECRYWALHNDVAGMCGGLTEQEREQWRRDNNVTLPTFETVEQTDRRLRDQVILQLLRGGSTAQQAGEQVGTNRKAVERVKKQYGFNPEDWPQAWRHYGLIHANLESREAS